MGQTIKHSNSQKVKSKIYSEIAKIITESFDVEVTGTQVKSKCSALLKRATDVKVEDDFIPPVNRSASSGADTNIENNTPCKECGELVPRASLAAHIKQKHNHSLGFTSDNKKEKTQCQVCGEVLQQASLKAHMSFIHGNVSKYTCPHCDFQCKYPANLKKHIEGKHENLKKHFCEICGYRTKTKQQLLIHKNNKHGNEKICCEICGLNLSCKEALKNHIKNKHTENRETFFCDMCEYKTHYKQHFVRHKESHSGYTIKCSECGNVYKEESGLRVHIKSAHLGQRYICKICEHVTTQLCHIKAHMAKHKQWIDENSTSIKDHIKQIRTDDEEGKILRIVHESRKISAKK